MPPYCCLLAFSSNNSVKVYKRHAFLYRDHYPLGGKGFSVKLSTSHLRKVLVVVCLFSFLFLEVSYYLGQAELELTGLEACGNSPASQVLGS